jgi:hypothetical protein
MDDWLKREHLAQTERHIAQGEKNIAGQQAIVAGLERTGRDATAARDLLRQFKVTQLLRVTDRDRLRRELGS